MTAQIPDCVIFQGCEFSLSRSSGGGLFSPTSDVIHPVALNTACYRGFICLYTVRDGLLYLEQVQLGLSPMDTRRARSSKKDLFALFGVLPKKADGSQGFGGLLYSGIDHVVPFSGGLLIVKDSLSERRGVDDLSGCFWPWHYQTVWELSFANGTLLSAVERSSVFDLFFSTFENELPVRDYDSRKYETARLWLNSSLAHDYKLLDFAF